MHRGGAPIAQYGMEGEVSHGLSRLQGVQEADVVLMAVWHCVREQENIRILAHETAIASEGCLVSRSTKAASVDDPFRRMKLANVRCVD